MARRWVERSVPDYCWGFELVKFRDTTLPGGSHRGRTGDYLSCSWGVEYKLRAARLRYSPQRNSTGIGPPIEDLHIDTG